MTVVAGSRARQEGKEIMNRYRHNHQPSAQQAQHTMRWRLRWMLALALPIVLVALAGPAQASMNKTRIMERDGEIIIVSQDVGNQAFTYQWVENDARRHAEDGLTLYYRIDRTELPPGISWEDTEAAIESAVATFNQVQCGKNFELVRVDAELGTDLGFIQSEVDFGGSPAPMADITFAGWVPEPFFDAVGLPGSMGVALPVVFEVPDDSLVWGLDVLDPTREFTDINGDRKHDLFATEIYFNAGANYVVDDPRGNTLFFIDLESIVLHELGHALGMAHFGRTKFILDGDGNLVDVILNENSANLMNTNNFFIKRDLSGSDNGSFCGLYGNWGKGPGAT